MTLRRITLAALLLAAGYVACIWADRVILASADATIAAAQIGEVP